MLRGYMTYTKIMMHLSFPEKLWIIFVRSDLSINISMSGNLFPLPVSLIVFPIQRCVHIHTSFFKLQLPWHLNYTATKISLELRGNKNIRRSR